MDDDVELIGTIEEIESQSLEIQVEIISYAYAAAQARLQALLDREDLESLKGFKDWATELAILAARVGLDTNVVLDAQEVARRAERATAIAIQTMRVSPNAGFTVMRQRIEAYEMVRLEDSEFEQVLKELRLTDGLKRGTVARACKERSGREVIHLGPRIQLPVSPIDRLKEMAADGATSEQIASEIGSTPTLIRKLARNNGITIHADKLTKGTSRVDPERIITETVSALMGIEFSIGLLSVDDYSTFDAEQIKEWVDSLEGPLRVLAKLKKELRKNV